VANDQSGGTDARPGISAWLAVGLALGWLAVLATFVRGIGSLLTAWAATASLAVVATRRRTIESPPGSPPGPLTGRPNPGSEGSATMPAPPIAGEAAEMKQATASREFAKSQEPGEEGKPPSAIGHQANPAEEPDITPASTPGTGTALGTVEEPTAANAPAAQTSTVLGLQVLTAAEVALVLRVDVDAVMSAIGNGELPGNRIGDHWRVDQDALARWLQGMYRNPGI